MAGWVEEVLEGGFVLWIGCRKLKGGFHCKAARRMACRLLPKAQLHFNSPRAFYVKKIHKDRGVIAGIGSCLSVSAITLTLTGSNTIGSVTPGTETATAANAAYLYALIYRNNNDTTTSPYDFVGTSYALNFDSGTTLAFPNALDTVETGGIGGDNSLDVTGFEYLIVKYGGAQGSALVFNVTDIVGDVTVPGTGTTGGNANKYLLFNSLTSPTPTDVPDGGATAMMVGAGLIGLGAMRQKLK